MRRPSAKFKKACYAFASRGNALDVSKIITAACHDPEELYKKIRAKGWYWSKRYQAWIKK